MWRGRHRGCWGVLPAASPCSLPLADQPVHPSGTLDCTLRTPARHEEIHRRVAREHRLPPRTHHPFSTTKSNDLGQLATHQRPRSAMGSRTTPRQSGRRSRGRAMPGPGLSESGKNRGRWGRSGIVGAFGAAFGRWGQDGAMSDAALFPSSAVYQLRVVLVGAL
jgi:hypothetical protein